MDPLPSGDSACARHCKANARSVPIWRLHPSLRQSRPRMHRIPEAGQPAAQAQPHEHGILRLSGSCLAAIGPGDALIGKPRPATWSRPRCSQPTPEPPLSSKVGPACKPALGAMCGCSFGGESLPRRLGADMPFRFCSSEFHGGCANRPGDTAGPVTASNAPAPWVTDGAGRVWTGHPARQGLQDRSHSSRSRLMTSCCVVIMPCG